MNYSFLSNTALFHGVREDELQEMLPCLNAHEREYQKNEIILRVGDTVSEIGLIESGSINIVVNFYWGNSHIFGHIGKGDVLAVAQVAGIMAAKKNSELIPMCHPLLLTKVDISFEIEETALHIRSEVRCHGETGVEMEALTAVSVAALTVYDMCKAVQRDMRIDGIHLLYKEGGKSGVYEAEE